MARGSKYTAEIDITVEDLTVRALNGIISRLDKLGPAGKKAAQAFDWGNLDALGREASGVIEKPLKKFADFEEQMDSVTAATFDLTKALDASGIEEMNGKVAELSATARKLGADTRYSATEAAAGMDILAKNFSGADMEKAEAVIAAMPGVLDTAAATKESIETAADVSSATMNQFGLAAKDFGMIGDVLVKTANSSATGLVDLGEALKYSGGTAHAANIDLETTLGMLGALGNAGKKGSVAGTGLASVLGNIQSGAKKQKSALAALGINIADKKGNLKPIVELLADLQKAADKKFGAGKGGVKRDRWLQGLVGMGNDKEALAILMKQAGTGELQTLIQANKEAEGTAKLVATAMSSNMAGATRELDSALEELQLTIGETMGPMAMDAIAWAKTAAQNFGAWAKENPELIKTLGSVLAVLAATGLVVSPVLRGFSAISTMLGGLSSAASFTKKTFGLFKDGFVVGMKAIATATLKSPLFWITALATGVALVIEYWEPISEFFTALWDGVVGSFKTAIEWILSIIDTVGNKVEEYMVAVMTPEQADLYAEGKATEAENAARAANNAEYGNLFSDNLDQVGSLTGRGGIGDSGGQGAFAANNAAYAVGAISRMVESARPAPEYGPAAPTMAEWNALANGGPMGPAILGESQPGQESRVFDGKLMITINSEGKVTKSSMSSEGDPNFAVRMNAGGQ